ncbi:OPT-domain-containing protein [Fistulina hepatica ATCC 64428]|uniref:OPT-domain-containing protein n=1 Tax=Fistulina hepatica ATCC 64428 TaxID=1128425 RepID=A0A0D7AG74_9AGAR|nr:OPT-domain-containing protein [Fistulina hepatica ATCC 64428]
MAQEKSGVTPTDSQSDYSGKEKGGLTDVNVIATNIEAVGNDVGEAMGYAKTMSDEDVEAAIRVIVERHSDDPNFPSRPLALAQKYLDTPNARSAPGGAELFEELRVEAALITINSPYPEVRAVVDNHDNPEEHCLTFRAWVIGIVYVAFGAFVNQFFSIRQASALPFRRMITRPDLWLQPGITVAANVAQILAYPAGRLFAATLPTRRFTTFGYTWSLNPGLFNKKEHMVITIMANVGFNTPYTAYIIWVQYPTRFFNQKWALNFGYQILTALSTNFIGYGLAGVTRRFLVYPYYTIWPANLATIALNRAFHEHSHNAVEGGWRVSRMRYFLYCFCGMFVYFWLPDYLFTALSYFNWITWIAPDNVNLAAITGGIGGLGFNPISTFDYNQMVVMTDPIISPFYSTMNTFLGALITFPIIVAVWYSNTFYTGYLPINSNAVFDNTGVSYNVSKIVNADTKFDEAGYKAYSPAYLAAGNIMLYCFFFAVYTATIVHAFLYHRREITHGFRALVSRRSAFELNNDVHMRLMSAYKEVPEWWYFIMLCISIGLGAAGVGAYPTHASPAVVLYGVFLAVIFCIPVGIILSVTNIQITLNVVAEMLGGLWFEGDALSMNYFKAYGYVTTAHTLAFAQDLKLAHYVHIPQRITFTIQTVATVVSSFVAMAIVNFQMTSIPDVCAEDQKDNFTCPGINTFFTASVLWGTLGPRMMFGPGKIYSYLLFGFLAGAILPIPVYFLRKKYRMFEYLHVPVLLAGALVWAPYNLQNIWPAVPVAWFFNFYVKKRYLGWWSKYNYITSGAFNSAIALSAIVIFFALQWPNVTISWSGNDRPYEGCDNDECPRLSIPAVGYFGPGVGEF